MPSSRNISTASSKKPCEKGMMRTKVVQYRCVKNKTFHENFINKLINARPRSSRRSSSLVWHTPKSRSLRKASPSAASPRRVLKPSLANAIKSINMNTLRKASPRRIVTKPSFLDDIKGKPKLRKVSYSPVKKLPVVNNKYNELLNKLALRRKNLKESSGSGDWS